MLLMGVSHDMMQTAPLIVHEMAPLIHGGLGRLPLVAKPIDLEAMAVSGCLRASIAAFLCVSGLCFSLLLLVGVLGRGQRSRFVVVGTGG